MQHTCCPANLNPARLAALSAVAPADGSLGSMDAVAVATPGCAAHHHSGAVSSYDASCEAAPACTHEAGGRCPMCDLTTKDPARDADWTQLVGTLFRASPHDSAIFALALPAVLALAADPLLSMVDTIFVGQVGSVCRNAGVPLAFVAWYLHSQPQDAAALLLSCCSLLICLPDCTPRPYCLCSASQVGADALAALGVNSALFTFSFVVFNFLATATTPMVAAALAVGDSDRAGKVTLQVSAPHLPISAAGAAACLLVGISSFLPK